MAEPFDRITANLHVIYPRYDPQNFVGREWLVEEVTKFRDDPERRHLLIVGEPGGGKSSFLAYLAETWNCPLYFIRADNVSSVASTDPRSFLISLGAQLHEKYGPDIFDDGESVRTSVTVGLAEGEAEVVGRFIKELRTPLPFLTPKKREVQVSVTEARDEGRVVGEYVERLVVSAHTLDPVTLLHIAVLGPVKKIGELYPNEKVIILIDALDESLQHTGTQIIDVIPHVTDSDFPPNMRLVMTSRPGAHLDEAGLRAEDRLHLDDEEKGYWQANRRDSFAYINKRLQEPALAVAIETWPQPKLDAYITQVMDSSDGNFLYLHFFFQELLKVASGGGTSLDEVGVPQGLDEIYRKFAVANIKKNAVGAIQFVADGDITESLLAAWRAVEGVRQVNVTGRVVTLTVEDSGRVLGRLYPLTLAAGVRIDGLQITGTELGSWELKYVPVLGILAVALQPLSIVKLAEYSRVEPVYVGTIVAQLKQFLDEVSDSQVSRYRFYHSSFADYLLDSSRNRDFHLDGPACHYQIAAYYRGAHDSLADVDWVAVDDDYPFNHLITHLEASERFEELHQLVATGGEQLTWAEANHRQSGSYFRCVQGLEAAWSHVPDATWEGVGRRIRYALIRGSFNSLVENLPAELIVELVKSEMWFPVVGLLNAAQIPDEQSKIDAIRSIVPFLSDQQRESVINFARNLTDDKQRSRLLFALAPQLPDDLCVAAWEYGVSYFGAVLTLDHKALNERRQKTLHTVAPFYLRQTATRLAADDAKKFLCDLFRPVLTIQSQTDRDAVLDALTGYLPDDLVDAAWDAGFDLEDDRQRGDMLGALSKRLRREQLSEALSDIEGLEDESARAAWLQVITPGLTGEFVETAFALLDTILEPKAYADTLSTFVLHMPGETIQSAAWRCAIRTGGRAGLVQLLGGVTALPPEAQRNVVNSALEILKEAPNPGTLTKLLYRRLSDLPQNAHHSLIMASLSAGQIGDDFVEHLGTIMSAAGGNAGDAISKIFELRTRIPGLQSRLPDPEMRQQLAAEFEQVISSFEQLVDELPPALRDEVVEAAYEVDLDDLLVALAAHGLMHCLPDPFATRSISAVLNISDPYWRALSLANLVGLVEEPLREKVLAAAVVSMQEITDQRISLHLLPKFCAVLPQRFAAGLMVEALQSMTDAPPAAIADITRLIECAVALPSEQRERVVGQMLLRIAADANPDESSTGQQVTLRILQRWVDAGSIPEIYAHLPAEQKEDFLQLVSDLPDELGRAAVLMSIDAPLPESWQQKALDIASALTDPWRRAETLRAVAEHLGEDRRAEALEAALVAAGQVINANASVSMAAKGLGRLLANPVTPSTWPRAVALTLVAQQLPLERKREVLQKVLDGIRRIDDGVLRWQLWSRLVGYLSAERQAELFAMLSQEAAEDPKAWLSFFTLTPHIPEYVMNHALPLIRQLPDKESVVFLLGSIARRLDAPARESLVREAFALLPGLEADGGNEQARAMVSLGHLLPADLQKEALLLSRKLDEGPRARYLRSVTMSLVPDLIDDAVATCLEINDPTAQHTALTHLVESLAEPLKSDVVAQVEKDKESKATLLEVCALIGSLPEEIDPFEVSQEWAAAQAAASDPAIAAEATNYLLTKSAESLGPYLHANRVALLIELRNNMPLWALGGPVLVDEIFLASRDVSRWYP